MSKLTQHDFYRMRKKLDGSNYLPYNLYCFLYEHWHKLDFNSYPAAMKMLADKRAAGMQHLGIKYVGNASISHIDEIELRLRQSYREECSKSPFLTIEKSGLCRFNMDMSDLRALGINEFP